jgi:hypothetical protein
MMDGESLVTKLDGKSVAVDPGKHTFRFETSGLPALTEVVLIKEGERARVVNVTFDSGGPKAKPSNTSPPPITTQEAPPQGHSALPWVVVGVGGALVVAGAFLYLTSPSRPANCDATAHACNLIPGESQETLKSEQDRAGQADAQPVLGLALAGGGVVVAAAGLLWHFLEPTGARGDTRHGVRLMPWSTGRMTGLTASF